MFGLGRPSTLSFIKTLVAPFYMVWHGPPYGCSLPMGVCLICLAWPALWLRPPYGRVLNMLGMDRHMAAATL